VLVLQGGTEMPLQFQILRPDRIRQMDLEGKPIVSDLPYELHSDGALDPTDISLFLGGQMTYQADGARFTECLTGRSYAIAAGGEAGPARSQRQWAAGLRALIPTQGGGGRQRSSGACRTANQSASDRSNVG
jgi:uncharacterized lipoprotein NlpE involved in copper resistance